MKKNLKRKARENGGTAEGEEAVVRFKGRKGASFFGRKKNTGEGQRKGGEPLNNKGPTKQMQKREETPKKRPRKSARESHRVPRSSETKDLLSTCGRCKQERREARRSKSRIVRPRTRVQAKGLSPTEIIISVEDELQSSSLWREKTIDGGGRSVPPEQLSVAGRTSQIFKDEHRKEKHMQNESLMDSTTKRGTLNWEKSWVEMPRRLGSLGPGSEATDLTKLAPDGRFEAGIIIITTNRRGKGHL